MVSGNCWNTLLFLRSLWKRLNMIKKELRQSCRFDVFIVGFEHISRLVFVFPPLTLNRKLLTRMHSYIIPRCFILVSF